MNKSILVIDTPKSCNQCPCGTVQEVADFEYFCCCEVLDRDIPENEYAFKRPDWCPLKKIPQKKEIPDSGFMIGEMYGEEIGWNACIDEILKEKY